MPLMFGVMSFFFPAGLTLYIFTNTCLSALHSIYMNKYDKKSLEIAALLKKNTAAAEAAKNPGPSKKVIDAQSTTVADGEYDGDDEADAKGSSNKSAQSRAKRNNKKRRR